MESKLLSITWWKITREMQRDGENERKDEIKVVRYRGNKWNSFIKCLQETNFNPNKLHLPHQTKPALKTRMRKRPNTRQFVIWRSSEIRTMSSIFWGVWRGKNVKDSTGRYCFETMNVSTFGWIQNGCTTRSCHLTVSNQFGRSSCQFQRKWSSILNEAIKISQSKMEKYLKMTREAQASQPNHKTLHVKFRTKACSKQSFRDDCVEEWLMKEACRKFLSANRVISHF